MTCPSCGSKSICAGRKQRAFYPLAPVVILGVTFAMFHQLAEAGHFHCEACGHDFRRRTVIARIAFVLLIFLIAWFALSIIGLFLAFARGR